MKDEDKPKQFSTGEKCEPRQAGIVKSIEGDEGQVEYHRPFLIVARCGDMSNESELKAFEERLEEKLSAKYKQVPPVIAVDRNTVIEVVG